jgi:hypothetical protein
MRVPGLVVAATILCGACGAVSGAPEIVYSSDPTMEKCRQLDEHENRAMQQEAMNFFLENVGGAKAGKIKINRGSVCEGIVWFAVIYMEDIPTHFLVRTDLSNRTWTLVLPE